MTNLAEEEPLVNHWLSMSGVLNEQDVKLQNELMERQPQHANVVQLESIYRQLALINYRSQVEQARRIPGSYRTYTLQLSLLGATQTVQGGSLDQILPSNPNRRRMTLLCSGAPAYISDSPQHTLQETTTVGGLVMLPYSIIPIGVRTPIESRAPLYAVGSSSATACVLTIIEELYVDFSAMESNHQEAEHEMRARLDNNPLEMHLNSDEIGDDEE